MNFGFSPEYTLNMSYPLLMSMILEHNDLNHIDESKDKEPEKEVDISNIQGIVIEDGVL